jgi:hypothetical protein
MRTKKLGPHLKSRTRLWTPPPPPPPHRNPPPPPPPHARTAILAFVESGGGGGGRRPHATRDCARAGSEGFPLREKCDQMRPIGVKCCQIAAWTDSCAASRDATPTTSTIPTDFYSRCNDHSSPFFPQCTVSNSTSFHSTCQNAKPVSVSSLRHGT